MKQKKNTGRKAENRTDRRQDTRTDDMKHSTYYHSYFEGYTEARVPANNRKGYKIERVYTSDYYVMKDQKSSVQKVRYLILFLAALIAFIAAAVPATAANMAVYVALPAALSMIALFLSGAVLAFYMAAPAKMTIYQHSYSGKLKLATGAAAILTGLCVLATLLSLFLIADSFSLRIVLSIALYLISFLCILYLNRLENHTGYTREHNPTEGPAEGNVIC